MPEDIERFTKSIESVLKEVSDVVRFVRMRRYDLLRLSMIAMSLKLRIGLLASIMLFLNILSLPVAEETEKSRCLLYASLIRVLFPDVSAT